MQKRRVFSGAEWEAKVGYCRAVAVGNVVFVGGTAPVALGGGGTHAPGDAYAQASRCFEIIEGALTELGGSLADVVRTRMYVTDISRWAEIGRAHSEKLGAHAPAATMVEVSRLIADDMLIEIEADAVLSERRIRHRISNSLRNALDRADRLRRLGRRRLA